VIQIIISMYVSSIMAEGGDQGCGSVCIYYFCNLSNLDGRVYVNVCIWLGLGLGLVLGFGLGLGFAMIMFRTRSSMFDRLRK